jgi:hypothetical protein
MLEVCFGEQAMGRTQVFEWFSKFKCSVTSREEAESSGRPSTNKTDDNVNKVKELVHKIGRFTTSDVANMLRISCTVLNNTQWSQMTFANSEIYYEIISEDNTSKLSHVPLKLSTFWIKGSTSSFNDLPPGALQARK